MDKKKLLKRLASSVVRYSKPLINGSSIPCYWFDSENWGDALNPYLVGKISGHDVRNENSQHCWRFFVIGSILQQANSYSSVWGSGMIKPDALPGSVPANIYAVRGALTQDRLSQAGIKCPKVYGDPALLLPKYYRPKVEVEYKIGIIPHYVDVEHPWIKRIACEDDVNLIDVKSGIEDFVENVLSCECIISSSLHGLICADAYGVPNRRMVLSDNIVGGDFKFLDYYSAHGIVMEKPLRPKDEDLGLSFVHAVNRSSVIHVLDDLLAACPFLEE